jgi:hypothetical protein
MAPAMRSGVFISMSAMVPHWNEKNGDKGSYSFFVIWHIAGKYRTAEPHKKEWG